MKINNATHHSKILENLEDECSLWSNRNCLMCYNYLFLEFLYETSAVFKSKLTNCCFINKIAFVNIKDLLARFFVSKDFS